MSLPWRWMLLAAALWGGPARAQTNAALTLAQAYDRALATDQSIGIAMQEVRKAGLLPWSAATAVGPRLSANASYEKPEHEITGDNGPIRTDTRRADITYQQPLFDPTVFAAIRAGRLSVEASRLAYKSAVRAALFGVTEAYYGVLRRQHIVEVNRETLQLAREQLGLAERRYQVGVAVKTDLLRARVQVEQANRGVTESENALQLSQTVLAHVLNFTNFGIAVSEPAQVAPPRASLPELLQRAFERREDFLAGRLAIRQGEENHNVARADAGPRVVGQLSYQWIDPETQSQKSDFWDAIIAVRLPLLDGGRRSVDLKRTALDVAQARLRQESLEKAVDQDVRTAWLNVFALEKTLAALRAQVEAASENHKDLLSQYRAGSATSLDVMTALNDLNSARRDLTTQTYDYQVALLNLDRATGTFQDQRVEKLRTP